MHHGVFIAKGFAFRRASLEFYKLRSFSIKKGRVIRLGDSLESRKSRSSSPASSSASPSPSRSLSPATVSPGLPHQSDRGKLRVCLVGAAAGNN